MNIIFIQVRDNRSKQLSICQKAQLHFLQGDRVQIIVPNEQAATYVDELLWNMPEESFLPHTRTHIGSKDRVIVSTQKTNLNQANIMFNLCPEVVQNFKQFETIYELYDKTHPEKERVSKQRYRQYQSLNITPHT